MVGADAFLKTSAESFGESGSESRSRGNDKASVTMSSESQAESASHPDRDACWSETPPLASLGSLDSSGLLESGRVWVEHRCLLSNSSMAWAEAIIAGDADS